MRRHGLLFTAAALLCVTKAAAQVHVYHHSATAAEAYLRGSADFIDAYGRYNLNTAKAYVELVEAERGFVLNHDLGIELWRKQRAEYRAKLAARCRATADWAKAKAEATRANPPRFSTEMIDAETHGVVWPTALVRLDGANTAEIDRLVAKWFEHNGCLNATDRAELKTRVRGLEKHLAAEVRHIGQHKYQAAKRLLTQIISVTGSDRYASEKLAVAK